MQFTLNFDLSIIAKKRQTTLRKQRKREKQKKHRQSRQLLAQNQLIAQQQQQFNSELSILDIENICISSRFCHLFQVNEQSLVQFRESHYIVNDLNDMTWFEIDRIHSRIQDFVNFCRFLFDVVFENTINENIKIQIVSQQKQNQKKQQTWERQIFVYWWNVKQIEVSKIFNIYKREMNNSQRFRLTLFKIDFTDRHCNDVEWINSFYQIAIFVWITRYRDWKNRSSFFVVIKSMIYSSLITTIRVNDEIMMRIMLREKIVKYCRFDLEKKTLYDDIQRNFDVYLYSFINEWK